MGCLRLHIFIFKLISHFDTDETHSEIELIGLLESHFETKEMEGLVWAVLCEWVGFCSDSGLFGVVWVVFLQRGWVCRGV